MCYSILGGTLCPLFLGVIVFCFGPRRSLHAETAGFLLFCCNPTPAVHIWTHASHAYYKLRPGDLVLTLPPPACTYYHITSSTMAIKLDLTDLNKLFDKPSSGRPSLKVQTTGNQAWLEQFFARVHLTESLNNKQQSILELSPLSSNATLVDQDDPFMDICKGSPFTDEVFSPLDVQGDLQLCSIMSERSRHFVHEIHRRTEHRKALSTNTNIPPCPTSPSPSSSVSSNSFNPNATAFIPSYFPTPARSTPSPSASVSSSASINPNAAPFVPSCATTLFHDPTPPPQSELAEDAWFPIFWEGVSTVDVDSRKLHASALVDSIEWESDSLAVLSQHFCWKSAEGSSDGLGSVVLFVRAVHDCLTATYGDWYANCLTRHIRECVVGHFKACWKSVSLSVPQSFYPFPYLLLSSGTTRVYNLRQPTVNILSLFSPQPHDFCR